MLIFQWYVHRPVSLVFNFQQFIVATLTFFLIKYLAPITRIIFYDSSLVVRLFSWRSQPNWLSGSQVDLGVQTRHRGVGHTPSRKSCLCAGSSFREAPSPGMHRPGFPPSGSGEGASCRHHALSAVHTSCECRRCMDLSQAWTLIPPPLAYYVYDLGQVTCVWPSCARKRVLIPNHNIIAMKLHVNKVIYKVSNKSWGVQEKIKKK